MKWRFFCQRLIISISLIASSSVLAYDEPFVNLGQTSFLDGGPPAGPGFYFVDYLQYYNSNQLNGNNGSQLPLPQTNFEATVNLAQAIYLTKQKFLGGGIGFDIIVPWVIQADVNDGLHRMILKSNNGIGNISIGPLLQFDPIMGPNGPVFVQRIEFDVILPNGRYHNDISINPSSNFWSINPYWAGTLWFTPKWSASVRMHYLWNAENTTPCVSFGPMVRTTQAGQAVFADYATEYQVVENLRVGLNGYFFNQFTDTKVNGVNAPGRREKVWAIGPGAVYSINHNNYVFVNINFEQDAVNRPQGVSFQFRYVLHV